MSMFDMMKVVDPSCIADSVFEHPEASKCLMPMGMTSENVVAKFGITREQMDKMAMESHQKAAHSMKMGWSQKEITPYKTMI